MLHAAHASRYRWGEVGVAVNLARGEWLGSRVYSVLGRAAPGRTGDFTRVSGSLDLGWFDRYHPAMQTA
jgi:hypothetical protein